MARVFVSRERFLRGEFPPVCVVTGEPADHRTLWRFKHLPSWTYILLLFGIVPFLVAWAFSRDILAGTLPMSGDGAERMRRLHRYVWGTAALGFGFPALVAAGGAPGWLWGAPAVAGLVVFVGVSIYYWVVAPNAEPAGQLGVELYHVHPRFAEAVARDARV